MKRLKKISVAILLLFLALEAGVLTNIIKLPQADSKDDIAKSFKEQCFREINWTKCYGEKLAELSEGQDLLYSLDVLNILTGLDPKSKECHIMAHYLAITEVEKNPKKWADIFHHVDISDCESGFLHGGLEGLGRYDSSFIIDAEKIIEVCEEIDKIKSSYIVKQGCGHAFGHLLLGQNYITNIEASIDISIAECDKLPDFLVRECNAGIFMESYTRENLYFHWNIPKIDWASEDYTNYQETLCSRYEGITATACWQEMAQLYSVALKNDPEKVFQACSKAPTWENTGYCYMKAANIFATSNNNDTRYLNSICKPLAVNPEYHEACIEGALSSIISSPPLLPKSIDFCQAIDDADKNLCYKTLVEVLKNESKLNKDTCNLLPKTYRNNCE